MPYRDPEKRKQYGKDYYRLNKEELLAKCLVYNQAHRKHRAATNRSWRERIKFEVFVHYSGSPPKCAYCGEEDIEVLCIDHIEDNGAEMRRTLKTHPNIPYWLRKNNYPEGFQVLCANCNLRKERRRRKIEGEFKWKKSKK